MNLTDLLKPIEDRLRAATPGPWENEDYRSTGKDWRSTGCIWHFGKERILAWTSEWVKICRVECDKLDSEDTEAVKTFEANAELIAHAPTDIAKLIEVVKVLDEAIRFSLGKFNTIIENPHEYGLERSVLGAELCRQARAKAAEILKNQTKGELK